MIGTRERVLEAALQLFNQQGTASVSTNHIALAAGISPGNLYYHFRNKEQIIRALFEQLFGVWDALFELAPDRMPSLNDLRGLVEANFNVSHEYRFVYRELGALLRRDAELSARYIQVRQRGFDGFRELFSAFAAAGVLRAGGAADVERLAELCWLISEFWLPRLELSATTVDRPGMQRGAELMLFVLGMFSPASHPQPDQPDDRRKHAKG